MRIKLSKTSAAALLLVLFCAGAAETKADPMVMTFDDLPTGHRIIQPESGRASPYIFSFDKVVGRDINLNTRHSLTRVLETSQAASPSNAVFSLGSSTASLTYDSLEITFTAVWHDFPALPCERCTNFLAFNVVGTVSGQTDPWEVAFYNRSGQVLFSVTGVSDQLVSFLSDQHDIAAARLFTSASGEGIDNLTYNERLLAPEPGALLLLGTGLAGAFAAARRRRGRPGRAPSSQGF